MKSKRYVLIRYTGKTIEDHESLYYEPYYELFGDDFWDEIDPVRMTQNSEDGWKREASPIKISDMEKTIAKLKKEGATHMEVMFHEDHDSYCISGVEIREANEEEIKEFTTEVDKAENEKLNAKKGELEKELKEIDSKLEDTK